MSSFVYGQSKYGSGDQLGVGANPSPLATSVAFFQPTFAENATVALTMSGVVFAWGKFGDGFFGMGYGGGPFVYGKSKYGSQNQLNGVDGKAAGVGTIALFSAPKVTANGVRVTPPALATSVKFYAPGLAAPTLHTTTKFYAPFLPPNPLSFATSVAFPTTAVPVLPARLSTTTAFFTPTIKASTVEFCRLVDGDTSFVQFVPGPGTGIIGAYPGAGQAIFVLVPQAERVFSLVLTP